MVAYDCNMVAQNGMTLALTKSQRDWRGSAAANAVAAAALLLACRRCVNAHISWMFLVYGHCFV